MKLSNKIFFITTLLISQLLNASQMSEQQKKYWYDGNSEISTYDYTINRYGEERKGIAVAIIVAESFDTIKLTKSNSKSTKSVLKLNMIRDFPTGIYDYNMMTSTFVSLESDFGNLWKSSFSSQEWCGHMWSEINRNNNTLKFESKSYFEGENNQSEKWTTSEHDILAEQIFLLVRGISKTTPKRILSSQIETRLKHKKMAWSDVESYKITESKYKMSKANLHTIKLKNGTNYVLKTLSKYPHELVEWQFNFKGLSESAKLIKSAKLKYWNMNNNKDIESLPSIGLKKRPIQTP